MPIMELAGLPPNSTVYIRIWPETGTGGTFEIRVSSGAAPSAPFPFTTPLGTASPLGSGCVRLTAAVPGQVGCAYNPVAYDFTQPFEIEFNLNFGTNNANGADGIVLGFQQTAYPHSGPGGAIGVQGLPNSFFVEFDTWDNGAAMADIADDHVSVFTNGAMGSPISGPISLGNIEDGNDYTVKFICCLLYTSPSPRDRTRSRMPSSA